MDTTTSVHEPVAILLVEDYPGDIRLTREVLREGPFPTCLHVACDGIEALAYVRREGKYVHAARPDLILLDLNLPRMHGHQVLAEIKRDPHLEAIWVIVFTTSQAEEDVARSAELHADGYVTKPVNLDDFFAAIHAIHAIQAAWLSLVPCPHG